MAKLSHLNALQALEASVRHGSFTAAAAELGVTPAAIGQQVRKLEAALGSRLLHRHANGFEPSATALSAAAKLTSGFDDLRQALAIMSGGDTSHRVFVTVPPTIGERWLAPRLSHFLAHHSEVDLRIDSTPYVLYRTSSEFDFAIRYDRPGASGYDEVALFGEVLIPVCTPAVVTRIGPTDRADCLLEAPLLHVDRSTDDPDWLHWEEWAQKFGYDIPTKPQRLHITFTTMALRALYDGHGLHLAQLSITLPDLLSGRLVAPFGVSTCVRPGYPYCLVRMNTGRETSLLRAFRDWVIDEARTTQDEMDAYLAADMRHGPGRSAGI